MGGEGGWKGWVRGWVERDNRYIVLTGCIDRVHISRHPVYALTESYALY